MLQLLPYVAAFLCFLPLQAQVIEEEPELLKEYVRSFALQEKDTILIALNVPYEIVEWDRHLVRTFTQVEAFSLPEEYLRRLSRKGRYSVTGSRKEHTLEVKMDGIGHHITVQGIPLTDEVAVKIYAPIDFPLKVVCSNKTPEEQLEELWLQQEVLTRKMNNPIKRAINADFYPDLNFQEGKILAAELVGPGTRFLELKIEANGSTYTTISRIGRLYNPTELLNRDIVFVAHNFRQELRKRPNQGMVLVQENENGELILITKKDIPDFLFLN
ncbi:MAG: hypothetical protein ACRBFS_12560 [Aureispira sp.]